MINEDLLSELQSKRGKFPKLNSILMALGEKQFVTSLRVWQIQLTFHLLNAFYCVAAAVGNVRFAFAVTDIKH